MKRLPISWLLVALLAASIWSHPAWQPSHKISAQQPLAQPAPAQQALAQTGGVQAGVTQVAGDAPGTRLTGARAIIDASRYPSLQAALDALPAEGGMVQIPPGTFEIDQPLVLRRGDACLLGAGTATHIKNVNTEGRPALIVAHPENKDARTFVWPIFD
jgi:hypothetical protein